MIPRGLQYALSPFRLGMAPFWRRSWKHRLARYALDVAFVYIAIAGLMMFFENRLLYLPSPADDWYPPPPSLHAQDVALSTSAGIPIHAWWCPPADWKPSQGAVIYCHGNGGNLSYRGEPALIWQSSLHQAVLLFDYPGYGKSGGKPSEAGCYAAADAAYAWLIDVQKMPANNILIMGSSLGGGVAVDLASRKPHRALVLVSTFTSIPDLAQRIYFWLPVRLLARNRFDNLAKIPHCSGPVFLAHGTADDMIPIAHSKRLFVAANEPKRLLEMPGEGHVELLTPTFFAALQSFLQEHAPLN